MSTTRVFIVDDEPVIASTSLPFPQLKKKQQTGSKVRCHLLTRGTKYEVAQRLTSLIETFGEVLATDSWMPDGFTQPDEAQLHISERIIP